MSERSLAVSNSSREAASGALVCRNFFVQQQLAATAWPSAARRANRAVLLLSSSSLLINATSWASSSAIDMRANPLPYFNFASAPLAPADSLLMIVPIGTPSATAASA